MPDGFIERMGLQAVLELKEFRQNARIYDQGIKQLNQQTQKVAEQTQKSANQMAGAWDHFFKQVEASTKGIDRSYKQVAAGSKKASTDMEKALTGMAKKALAAAAAFMTLRKAVGFLQQATQLAARVETLGVSLAIVGKNAGYTTEQIAKYEEAVKEQGITTRVARQSLLQMAQAQIDFAHATDLARIAQDAAVITGQDSSQTFEELTLIIQRGIITTNTARSLGLQFGKAYEQMAAQVGKTTEELTDQERIQARVNEVMRAGAGIAGTYEGAMETAGKMQASLNRLFEETQLAIGRIQLGGFATGIDEITRLMKDLGEWLEENEKELEDLGLSVTMLVDAMVTFADLDLPVDELTDFIDKLTTLASILAIGIETVKNFREENNLLSQSLDRTLTVLSALNKFAAWPITVMDVVIDKYTELRKADEDLFKTEAQLAKEREALPRGRGDIVRDDLARMQRAREAAAAAEAERLRELEEMREKAAEKLQDGLDRIADMQRDHYQKLAEMEADANRKRARDFDKFQANFRKQSIKGQVALSKITTTYEKQRAKTTASFQKQIEKARAKISEARVKAAKDFEQRERRARERFQLNALQSERRYQFERGRLVAEGDTLAIEELDARYKLEQEEAKENEALRKKQSREGQTEQIREAGEAAREQINELQQQLDETLDEQEANYQDQIEAQKQANIARLVEITQAYQDQQALKDEDDALAMQKADANYQRQLEDLGSNLSDQEELQELGAEQTERVLDQYYGEGGISDRIMEGWHERENTRILVTAALLGQLAAGATQGTTLLPGGIPTPGQEVGMDAGGLVTGPATVRVGAGVVEAFMPLGHMGGGGSFDLSWSGGAIPITGLEGASSTDVSRIARGLAESLTAKIRTRRRN